MKNCKKLNKKGFTLVELLAVIIILAIVVGITIPAVLTMVDDARMKAGEDAAAVVADWVDKQYSLNLINLGQGTVSQAYTAVCPSTSCSVTITPSSSGFEAFVKAAGLTPNDVASIDIEVGTANQGDRACIKVYAAANGNFYVNRYASDSSKNVYSSVNCPTET